MSLRTVLLMFCASVLWITLIFIQDSADSSMQLHILDVGQGDAVLIVSPLGKSILVDGGGGSKVLKEVGSELLPWDRTIDVLILTHAHADHLEGLFDVVDRYAVNSVVACVCCGSDERTKFFFEEVRSKGIDMIPVESEEWDYSEEEFNASIIIPKYIRNGDSSHNLGKNTFSCGDSNQNNNSIITKVEFGSFSALLTGDAEVEEETTILASPDRSSLRLIDVLKAGHHCSRTASSRQFLHVVKPELAVCSLGKDNTFGHPHAETLILFETLGIKYMRTDEHGTVSIRSDGKTWEVY